MIYVKALSRYEDEPMSDRLAASGRAIDGKRVLLVDDDTELIDVLRAFLEDQGLLVTEAGTARQAFAMLRHTGPYDVLLLDIGLPDTDGLDLLERLRQEGYDLPVVMATADSTPVKVWRARQLGVTAYLTKPFEFDKLMQLMNRVLTV